MTPFTRLRRLAVAACLLAGLQLGSPGAEAADVPVYADSLAAGWADWSWGSTRNFANATPVHGGASSIAVTITEAWAALYLHANSPVAVNANDQLSFWIHGGGANHALNLVANNAGSTAIPVQANAWTQVSVTFSALGVAGSLTDLYWQDSSGAPQPVFYLDDIVIVPGAPPPPPPSPALAVDLGADRRAISDDIYGMNYAPEPLAAELRLPVRRWGGNSTTRYNWQLNTHNTGADFYFENIPDATADGAVLPNGSASDQFVEQDRRTGTKTLMTIPIIGWVPFQRLEVHPYDCGFQISKYGAQQANDSRYDPDCGNGKYPNGTAITGNDPTDTSVAVGPPFMAAWIGHLTGKYGTAANGGVAYYSLDNEPALWNSTHRDVHPLPLTYDELRDRSVQYGAAIKAADPTARTLGPAEWGWCGYLYSAADPGGCSNGPDSAAHGNTPLVAWYLQQMQAYQQANGVRLLDYLDLHFYPQANGVALSLAGGAATQELRLRTTRSLWDPAYDDESWISTIDGPIALRMIPRMKDWVAANYPGTKLAITEYNFGGLEHINGALAQADVLGIFGREGLDLATIWSPPDSAEPGAFAFRLYRNYDGTGKGFGETSVRATSTDAGVLAIHAAQRTSDGALTLMVINKSASDLTSAVALAGFAPQSPAAVYRYSGAAPGAIARPPDQALAAGGFTATFPANSITLFVIASATAASADTDDDGIPDGVELVEGRNPVVKDNDVFTMNRLFAMQQYRDFLGREGDAGGIAYYTALLDGNPALHGPIVESFFNSPEFAGTVSPVVRLYFAFFDRIPDYPGLQFQVNALRTGTPLPVIANNFSLSPEFVATYGALTDAQYVALLYQNVLGRTPAQAEIDFHVARLASGVTRGEVMAGFSESPEYIASSYGKVYVTMMYVGMLGRSPEQAGFDYWLAYMNAGNPGLALILGFLNAPEYYSRFLP